MGRLAARLQAVEAVVLAAADAQQDPERAAAEAKRDRVWQDAIVEVLQSMPERRAMAALAELQAAETWEDLGPIARRVRQLADSAVPGDLPECQFTRCGCARHYGRNGPLVLPEALCALLEAHGDAVVFDYYNCRDCNYQSGERGPDAWAAYRQAHLNARPSERSYFDTCPVCGGPVGWRAYQVARQYRLD